MPIRVTGFIVLSDGLWKLLSHLRCTRYIDEGYWFYPFCLMVGGRHDYDYYIN